MSVERAICPDIYHPAVARDGLLTRLRIPGGVLTVEQCLAIEDLLATTGLEFVQVTNRANLQLRGLHRDLPSGLLANLRAVGLVGASAVDGIRNIMASPIAGIDGTELIDVRPLVAAWDEYLSAHPELGVLSNKFSVGFDGGGCVSIVDRPNDLTLLAVAEDEFLLHLVSGGLVRVGVDECIPVLGAIAEAYRRGCEGFEVVRHPPRLREVIEVWGVEGFLKVCCDLEGVPFTEQFALVEVPAANWASSEKRYTEDVVVRHLGVWRQQQEGLSYVGVVLPLGRLSLAQMRGLGEAARLYGNDRIRLTPWQNVIIPDIPDGDLVRVLELIKGLGLGIGAHDLDGLLMACAGASGCQFSATDTQSDALAISAYLKSQFDLDSPVNIHVSGCDKSCAQHYPADIALWGCGKTAQRGLGYRLCVSGGTERFGRELRDYLSWEDVLVAIEYLIRFYHNQRASPQESFRAFTSRQSLVQLQQVLHAI